MKKIVLSMAVFLLLAIGLVSAETTVETRWDGAGTVDIDFIAGDDARNTFSTGGSYVRGEYYGADGNNNPYGYGVDSVEGKVKAVVDNGFIEYDYTRTDAKTSMYGDAGQNTYTWINAEHGEFAWRTTSNFAQMRNCNYGWQSNNQIRASGNQQIYHSFFIDDEYNEGAEIQFVGDATTRITSMSEDHSGSSFKFGKGCGCYTNANVDIDGAGVFDLNAFADNRIETDTGITTDGYLNIHANFKNGFKYNNFALEGE